MDPQKYVQELAEIATINDYTVQKSIKRGLHEVLQNLKMSIEPIAFGNLAIQK